MSCKDCLHYEICEALYEMNGISKIFPSQCSFYKNNKMNNWISVKDRLPEDDLPKDTNRVSIKVLVYSANGNKYSVRTLSRQRWIMNYKPLKYHDWEWSRDAKNITHWMPLPEPPKGENNHE